MGFLLVSTIKSLLMFVLRIMFRVLGKSNKKKYVYSIFLEA